MLITTVDSYEAGFELLEVRPRVLVLLEEIKQQLRGIGMAQGQVSVGMICLSISGLMHDFGGHFAKGKDSKFDRNDLNDDMRQVCDDVCGVCSVEVRYGNGTVGEFVESVRRRLDGD